LAKKLKKKENAKMFVHLISWRSQFSKTTHVGQDSETDAKKVTSKGKAIIMRNFRGGILFMEEERTTGKDRMDEN